MIYENDYGKIEVSEIGASLISWEAKYKEKVIEILAKYSNQIDYIENKDYLNSIIGPRSGRYIENGKIILHGGSFGYTYKKFNLNKKDNGIEATYFDEENETRVVVNYTLESSNLRINLKAYPKKKVHLNLTSHLYFSPFFEKEGKSVNDLTLEFKSDKMLEKENNVPTKIVDLKKEFDFNLGRIIEEREIDDVFLLHDKKDKLKLKGDISLELETSQRAVVIYTYDFPNDPKNKRTAVAIEPQEIPNINNIDIKKTRYFDEENPYEEYILWKVKF